MYCIYGKVVKVLKKFYVYDENNVVKMGDIVIIVEYRLLFKIKKFILVSVDKIVEIV